MISKPGGNVCTGTSRPAQIQRPVEGEGRAAQRILAQTVDNPVMARIAAVRHGRVATRAVDSFPVCSATFLAT
ncbi:hypothetical protein ILFOPFJJ_04230 [Ensifer psoraleae]|nr:hypothetical protein [Sinorhizobium psoraleae]